jgi:hypothetical protein
MNTIFELMALAMVCGTVLLVAFIFGLSIRQSPLKDLVVQVVGWGLAVFFAVWVISRADPIHELFLGPVGGLDDIAEAIVGMATAVAACRARKRSSQNSELRMADADRWTPCNRSGSNAPMS